MVMLWIMVGCGLYLYGKILEKGYVYSSKFCNKDKAEQDFRKHLDWGGDVEHIKFKHGKRD